MRLRYSHHVDVRMEEQGITREMVAGALASRAATVEGDTATEYEAIVNSRLMRIVLAADRAPSLVITVYWVE